MPDRSPRHREIAVLLARAAIREELTSYLDAVMRHDWERVAQSFTPSATLDYGTPGVTAVEANIDLLRAGVDRLTSKSTLLGMHADIDVSGDRARTQATTFTAHTPAPGYRPPGPNVGRGLRGRVVPRPRRQVAHNRPCRPPPTAGLARPRLSQPRPTGRRPGAHQAMAPRSSPHARYRIAKKRDDDPRWSATSSHWKTSRASWGVEAKVGVSADAFVVHPGEHRNLYVDVVVHDDSRLAGRRP